MFDGYESFQGLLEFVCIMLFLLILSDSFCHYLVACFVFFLGFSVLKVLIPSIFWGFSRFAHFEGLNSVAGLYEFEGFRIFPRFCARRTVLKELIVCVNSGWVLLVLVMWMLVIFFHCLAVLQVFPL